MGLERSAASSVRSQPRHGNQRPPLANLSIIDSASSGRLSSVQYDYVEPGFEEEHNYLQLLGGDITSDTSRSALVPETPTDEGSLAGNENLAQDPPAMTSQLDKYCKRSKEESNQNLKNSRPPTPVVSKKADQSTQSRQENKKPK